MRARGRSSPDGSGSASITSVSSIPATPRRLISGSARADRAPRLVVDSRTRAWPRGSAGRRGSIAFCDSLERGIPGPSIEGFIAQQAPDVVLITPLVDIGSPQLDHLAAAQSARRENGAAVASWDHLSSKALIRKVPDAHCLERDQRHGSDRDARRARRSGRRHGCAVLRPVVRPDAGAELSGVLRPRRSGSDRPYILYVCSSLFRGTTFEPAFTERWIQAVRGSADPRLKDIGILVRPHPRAWTNGSRSISSAVTTSRSGARTRSMTRRRRTTSTRSTTALRSSGSTPARSSRPPSSASRCSPSSCRRFPRTTRKARYTSGICSMRTPVSCACLAVSTSTCRSSPKRSPDTAAATPKRRGSWMASCVPSAARRPRRRDLSTRSRRRRDAGARAGRGRTGAGLAICCCSRSPASLSFTCARSRGEADAEPDSQELRASEAVGPALGQAARHRPVHLGGKRRKRRRRSPHRR